MEMERGSGWGMYGSGWWQTGQGGDIWPAAGHTREMRVHSLLAPVARGQHLSECAVAPSSAHNQPRVAQLGQELCQCLGTCHLTHLGLLDLRGVAHLFAGGVSSVALG